MAKRRRRARAIYRIRPSSRSRTVYINGGSTSFLLKAAFTSFAAGFAASGVAAVIDKQFSKKPMIARIGKVVAAFAIAKFGARHPRASSAAIGALGGSEGYQIVTRMLGGAKAAHTPDQAIKGLADMSESYPEMGALLNGGMGALLEGTGEDISNYQDSLQGSFEEDYA